MQNSQNFHMIIPSHACVCIWQLLLPYGDRCGLLYVRVGVAEPRVQGGGRNFVTGIEKNLFQQNNLYC